MALCGLFKFIRFIELIRYPLSTDRLCVPKHILNCHTQKRHKCSNCGKQYAIEWQLKYHLKTCGSLWTCSTCKSRQQIVALASKLLANLSYSSFSKATRCTRSAFR